MHLNLHSYVSCVRIRIFDIGSALRDVRVLRLITYSLSPIFKERLILHRNLSCMCVCRGLVTQKRRNTSNHSN